LVTAKGSCRGTENADPGIIDLRVIKLYNGRIGQLRERHGRSRPSSFNLSSLFHQESHIEEPSPVRVAGISSWEPRACGIATYFREQSESIARLGHEFEIICHEDSGGHHEQPGVHGLLDMTDPHWYQPVYERIANDLRPDVVHIQHEFGLYNVQVGDGSDDAAGLLTLLGLLKMEGIPTVITCHTLCGRMKPMEAAHYRAMIPLSTITVTHARYQMEMLEANLGTIPHNVTYVEHGANLHSEEEIAALRREGRRRFGFEGRPVVGINGWWAANKNFLPIIRGWAEVYPRLANPDTVLAVVGAARAGDETQVVYRAQMMRAIEESPVRDAIRVVEKSFSPEEFELSLAAFDLAVLPYISASQSGVAAHTGAVGTAMLLRDLEGLGAYARAADQALMPLTTDPAADAASALDSIVEIMNDEARLRRMQRSVAEYTREVLAWPRVAERYDRIYRDAVSYSRQVHDLQHFYARATHGPLAAGMAV
jgi:glycosyltransferase involved in cell wall biosynthesis